MISHPKRKCHLPTIHFQVRTVTFREGIHFLWFFKHPWNRTCKFRIWPEVPGTVATKRHWGSWAVLLGTPGEMVFVRFHGSKSVGLLNTHCGLERHFTKILLPKKQVKSRDFFWWKKMRVFVADPSRYLEASLPVGNISGNNGTLVPNMFGTGKWKARFGETYNPQKKHSIQGNLGKTLRLLFGGRWSVFLFFLMIFDFRRGLKWSWRKFSTQVFLVKELHGKSMRLLFSFSQPAARHGMK